MTAVPSDKAGENLSSLIDQVAESHEPVRILGKGSIGVLVAEEDWRAIKETLHLVSIPDMRESICEGMETPIQDCSEDPGW